jgi:hypothetical protein
VSDEGHPNHAGGDRLRGFGRVGQFDAASLAAAPGMNLRLDDDAAAQAPGDLARFRTGERHVPARNGHTIPRQNALRLILVDFHEAAEPQMLVQADDERQTSSHDAGESCRRVTTVGGDF